jgi:hypothetical protein
MIARCKQLGELGQFLGTLPVLLHEKVQQQVCIGGEMCTLFETYVGIKEGSELNPLLFGMFIDMLHKLTQCRCLGRGPCYNNYVHLTSRMRMMSHSLRMIILPNRNACWTA